MKIYEIKEEIVEVNYNLSRALLIGDVNKINKYRYKLNCLIDRCISILDIEKNIKL